MFRTIIIFLGLSLCLAPVLFGQNTPTQPIELGQVDWLRDFDQAIAQSKTSGKPVFILFQEVPGCSTCRNYGQNVLSQPVIVDAIENSFIPLAIFNNKKGKDYKVLTYYKEPAWNNPVVRIVASDKQDIVPRVSGNYSQLGVVQAMRQALDLSGFVVPAELQKLENTLRNHEYRTTNTP